MLKQVVHTITAFWKVKQTQYKGNHLPVSSAKIKNTELRLFSIPEGHSKNNASYLFPQKLQLIRGTQ
jgi:hypothetical protein